MMKNTLTGSPSPPTVTTMPAIATVIAPEGPVISDRVPPKIAAKNPAAIARYKPAAGPSPEATP